MLLIIIMFQIYLKTKTNITMKKMLGNLNLLTVLSVIGVVFLSGVFMSCNVSTANLSDVKVCSSLNGSECSSDVLIFTPDVSAIYCSASLNNAPSGTKVVFEWKHEGEIIGKAELEASSVSSGSINSSFKPSAELPVGKYSVTVKINTDNAKPVTKEFKVE